jgi:methylphosphotriester-DNA--protein-cysteine methyltransferase
MIPHQNLTSRDLVYLLKSKLIRFAGNSQLKIYGTLQCASGKRMKKENRVFFKNETEALTLGFRPCGHCLRNKYHQWKAN